MKHSSSEKQFSVAHKNQSRGLVIWSFFALFCHSRCQPVYIMRSTFFSRGAVASETRNENQIHSYCAAALVHYRSFSYRAARYLPSANLVGIKGAKTRERWEMCQRAPRAPREQFAQKRWWLMRIFHQLFRACRLTGFNGFEFRLMWTFSRSLLPSPSSSCYHSQYKIFKIKNKSVMFASKVNCLNYEARKISTWGLKLTFAPCTLPWMVI
jgi:hypothetical protein